MQWLAHSMWGLYLFNLMLGGAFWYFGQEFQNAGLVGSGNQNTLLANGLNMTSATATYQQQASGLSTGTGFNALFVFGDPLLGAGQFFQVLSGGAILTMEQHLGFDQTFQFFTMGAVLGLPGVGALIYYLSNRP